MKTFFGGQIKENYRGKWVAVINRMPSGPKDVLYYHAFVYHMDSEKLISLTENFAVKNPLDRVYIGVSEEIGDKIEGIADGRRADAISLDTIDEWVVAPYLLKKNPEKS